MADFSNHLSNSSSQLDKKKKNLLRPWWTVTTRLSSSYFLLPSSINLALHTIDKVLRVTYTIYIIWVCVCRVYSVYIFLPVCRARSGDINIDVIFFYLSPRSFSIFWWDQISPFFYFLFFSIRCPEDTARSNIDHHRSQGVFFPIYVYLLHVEWSIYRCHVLTEETSQEEPNCISIVSVLSCWFYLELNFLFFYVPIWPNCHIVNIVKSLSLSLSLSL